MLLHVLNMIFSKSYRQYNAYMRARYRHRFGNEAPTDCTNKELYGILKRDHEWEKRLTDTLRDAKISNPFRLDI